MASLKTTIGVDTQPLRQGIAQARQMFATEADRATADCKRFMEQWERATTHTSGVYQKEFRAMELAQMQAIQKEATLQQNAWREMEVAQNRHFQRQLQAEEAYQGRAYREMEVALLKQARLQEQAALKASSGPSARERRLAARAIGAPTTLGADLAGGIGAGVLGGAALLGVGAFAFKAATDVQSAFNTIRATTGETGASLLGLEDAFKHVGATVPNALSQTATAIATLHQRTGLTGAALESFAKQELTLARVTGTDVGEAIKKTTQLFNNWGVSVRDQPRYLDLLFKASQQTGASFTRLAEGMTRGGIQLRAFGFSFSEAAALMGKFDHEGVAAQQGVRTLQMVLAHMAKAGIGDAHAALAEFMRLLKAAPSDMAASEMAAKALGLRAGPQFAAMVREGRFEYEKTAAAIAGAHDTILAAGRDTETLGTAWKEAKNQLELALSPLGKSLIDVLKESVSALKPEIDGVQALGEAFGRMSQPGQQALVVLGGLAAIALTLGPEFAIAAAAVGALGYALADQRLEKASERILGKPGPSVFGYPDRRPGPPITSTPSSGFGLLHEHESLVARMQGNEPLGPSTAERLAQADRDRLAKMLAGKGGGKEKLSPFQKEEKSYNEEIARSVERLNELRAGEDNSIAKVTARYHLLSAAQREHLANLLNQIGRQEQVNKAQDAIDKNTRIVTALHKGAAPDVARLAGEYDKLSLSELNNLFASQKLTDAAVKAAESHKQYAKDIGQLNAAIRRLKQGHDAEASGVDALREKYPGLSTAMLAAMNNADQWKKHLQELRTEAHRVAESIRGLQVSILESGTDNRVAEAAARLFGPKLLEKGKHPTSAEDLLKNYLTPEQQEQARQAAGKGAFGDIDQRIKQERQRLSGVYGPLEGGDQGLMDRASRIWRGLVGSKPGQMLDTKSLDSLKDKSKELVQLSDSVERATAAIQVYDAEWSRVNTVSGAAGVNLELLQRQFAALTGKSATAREVMEQFGVRLQDLPDAAQRSMRAFLQLQHTMTFFKELAGGIQGVFEHLFTDLAQKGFKGFFRNVVDSFSQMLQQIAARYLASQLMNVIIPALGGLFGGGGGGSATDITDAIFGHRAMGGDVMAGKPYWVGEQGRELVVPRHSGTVIPNAALAGAGGTVHNHFNFTIHTPNPQAFRQSQHQIMGDAQAAAEAHRKRRGY